MDLIWEVLMAIPPKWQTFSMKKNQPLLFLDVIASAQTCKGSSFSPQPHPPRSRTYPDATNTTPAAKQTPTVSKHLAGVWALNWIEWAWLLKLWRY